MKRKLIDVDEDLWQEIKVLCVTNEAKISDFVDGALRHEAQRWKDGKPS